MEDLGDYFERRDGGIYGLVARALEGETTEDRAVFVASTAREDAHGDFVEQDWRLARFRRNPVLLYEHRAPIVGVGKVKIVAEHDRLGKHLQLQAQWDVGEHNPTGTLVAAQHARGFRSAVSVGFRPRKSISRRDLPEDDPRRKGEDTPRWRAGWVHRGPELLEVSSVAIPANPDAIQLRSWYGRDEEDEDPTKDPAQLQALLLETCSKQAATWILEAVRTDPQVQAAVRSILLDDPPRAERNYLDTLGIPR